MCDQTKQTLGADEPTRLERAVVLCIVGDERDRGRSREELAGELSDIEPDALADALDALDRVGVIELSERTVRASRATARLDELELIAL